MRASIMVILEDTSEKEAVEVKQAVSKVVEKMPKASVELHISGE